MIRIGVMGCANIARRSMIPAMIECKETELVAVASRTEEKARRVAERFGCQAITGYERLLERDDVDAIYLPLPTGLHEEWVSRTLTAEKHCLVEKSFALDWASAQAMVDLARQKKLLVLENFLFPHHSQHRWICRRLERGEIGELRRLRATFGFPPLPPDNFRYRRELGGGALIDAGTYVIKASTLFLGPGLSLRGATLQYDPELGVDLSGTATFENEAGQVAQVSFGFNHYYQCRVALLGSEGKLTAERAFTPPPGFKPIVQIERQDHKEIFTLSPDNYYVNMLRFFATTVRDQGDFSEHYAAVLHQARLLDAVRKEGTR